MKLPTFIVSNRKKKEQRANGAIHTHTHARTNARACTHACTYAHTHALMNTFSNDLVITLLLADASI